MKKLILLISVLIASSAFAGGWSQEEEDGFQQVWVKARKAHAKALEACRQGQAEIDRAYKNYISYRDRKPITPPSGPITPIFGGTIEEALQPLPLPEAQQADKAGAYKQEKKESLVSTPNDSYQERGGNR